MNRKSSPEIIALCIGFMPLMLVLLKAAGILQYSWMLVLSPFWVPLLVVAFCLTIIASLCVSLSVLK